MRIRLHVLSACVLVAFRTDRLVDMAAAPSRRCARPRTTPEEKAKTLYNQGVKDVKKADKFQASGCS